jgi:hypothetical protein
VSTPIYCWARSLDVEELQPGAMRPMRSHSWTPSVWRHQTITGTRESFVGEWVCTACSLEVTRQGLRRIGVAIRKHGRGPTLESIAAAEGQHDDAPHDPREGEHPIAGGGSWRHGL